MRYFGRIIYPAFAAALHNPLPRQRVVFQKALACIRSLVYWSLVFQYRIQTTETLNYLAHYLEEFHATKDDFKAFRKSKTTVAAAQACRSALQKQLIAQHANDNKENAECGVSFSHTEMVRRKAEDHKLQEEVYHNTVNKRTTFDFVKIHQMLHYEESVQRFGHLVKDSTETQQRNHPKMCVGPYRRPNRNFQYEQQILNDYSSIHVLRMQCLHLRLLE
jgi:hypothetical protein